MEHNDERLVMMVRDQENGFGLECDSHADTCCMGRGVMIVNKTDKTVKVTPFLKSLGSLTRVPIVSAAVAYDDPKSGEVIILIFHQALHMPELDHCLLCPMQLRLNDVVLNERPKFLTQRPTEEDHAMIIDDLIIPLELDGVTSTFPGRMPTQKEYEECRRYEVTYPHPEWCPHTTLYAEEEARFTNEDGTLCDLDRRIAA